jgi:hypothetical protein
MEHKDTGPFTSTEGKEEEQEEEEEDKLYALTPSMKVFRKHVQEYQWNHCWVYDTDQQYH